MGVLSMGEWLGGVTGKTITLLKKVLEVTNNEEKFSGTYPRALTHRRWRQGSLWLLCGHK